MIGALTLIGMGGVTPAYAVAARDRHRYALAMRYPPEQIITAPAAVRTGLPKPNPCEAIGDEALRRAAAAKVRKGRRAWSGDQSDP